ncbi:MAG: hypothetical protein LBE12_10050 [Planctomycetaceae bacterium]|jgi:hypothetical protein|nr:hypothetical protein [Planctomycetaceae bacterium]
MRKIPLFLVVPDRRLIQAVHVVDDQHRFETIRFRSLQNALEKENSERNVSRLLIVQWTVEEVLVELSQNKRFNLCHYSSRLIVYCPELLQKTVAEGEEIRFALLQLGVIAVFSQFRELPTVLSILLRCANRFPPPQKQWSQLIYDSLPWKK